MKVEIKNRWTNKIIYSYEYGNNTILKTVQEAIKNNINLIGASLSGADLSGANLSGAKMPIYSKWNVSMIDESIIRIGCKEKTIEDWVEWFENSNEEFDTKRDSEDFKRIKAMFYAYKTYLEILNK